MKLAANDVVKKLSQRDIWEQLNQTQEECAELVTAISHLRRKKGNDPYDLLCEEIADVFIMINQCYLFLDSKKIDKKVNEKIARARERLENGTI